MCPQVNNSEAGISVFVPDDLYKDVLEQGIEFFSPEFYALNKRYNERAAELSTSLEKLGDKEWSDTE